MERAAEGDSTDRTAKKVSKAATEQKRTAVDDNLDRKARKAARKAAKAAKQHANASTSELLSKDVNDDKVKPAGAATSECTLEPRKSKAILCSSPTAFTLQVSQLAAGTTAAALAVHLAANGCSVSTAAADLGIAASSFAAVCLVVDGATGKQTGGAVVHVADEASWRAGLKLHRSRFGGRLINVRPACELGGVEPAASANAAKTAANERIEGGPKAKKRPRSPNNSSGQGAEGAAVDGPLSNQDRAGRKARKAAKKVAATEEAAPRPRLSKEDEEDYDDQEQDDEDEEYNEEDGPAIISNARAGAAEAVAAQGPRRALSHAEKAAAAGAVKERLPRYLRLNPLKGMTFPVAKASLAGAGHCLREKTRKKPMADRTAERRSYDRDPQVTGVGRCHVAGLLVFKPKGLSNLSAIPLLRSGHLVAQQKASCFAALALSPPPGSVVLDACAAPGSKTSHLAALMRNQGTIFAFDRSPQRCALMAKVLAQRGVTNVSLACRNFLEVDLSSNLGVASPGAPPGHEPVSEPCRAATHVLLDPSCSSSGMSDRPHADPASVASLSANQLAVLKHAMLLPAPGLKIAYSTCSVLDAENERVVEAALASPEGQGFDLEAALPWWPRRGRPLFPGAEKCLRTTWEDGTIGFFLAVLRRRCER